MTTTRTDDPMALLRRADPVPHPDAAVDPAVRAATLERVLLAAPAGAPRRPRTLARRVALAGAVAVAASAGLLVAGEQRSAPQPVAVLPALAGELATPGGILHVVDRTVELGPDGEPRGPAHVVEGWMLLDDARVFRFRIGSGADAEDEASDAGTTTSYDPASNTVTTVRRREETRPVPVEPPVVELARRAAAGEIPIVARPVVRGRRTIQLEADGITWYVAEDAPELVRREWRLPDGPVQRTDFLTFEVLEATAENRALLRVQAPPG
ncbi:MAG TPA: hypothetical protein VGW75_01750, partial [Solirubrobacteraceae bacterium]|nr:hypothetical protein [Solirubrobacteraceae bacterium]